VTFPEPEEAERSACRQHLPASSRLFYSTQNIHETGDCTTEGLVMCLIPICNQ
jgi:hypothetical protein